MSVFQQVSPLHSSNIQGIGEGGGVGDQRRRRRKRRRKKRGGEIEEKGRRGGGGTKLNPFSIMTCSAHAMLQAKGEGLSCSSH